MAGDQTPQYFVECGSLAWAEKGKINVRLFCLSM